MYAARTDRNNPKPQRSGKCFVLISYRLWVWIFNNLHTAEGQIHQFRKSITSRQTQRDEFSREVRAVTQKTETI